MKTELLTVSKIFNEAIFRIPDYQRGYSWEESHLKDFWADLEQLDSQKSHYTGVLTLEEVPESAWARWEDDVWIIRSKKYSPYYVVDGQQRLTTISTLLQCILEITEAEELNYTPIEMHRRKYIFENRSDSLARAYIFGYEKDNPSREFLKQEIFADTSVGHSTGEATIYTRNLRNAKKFFLEKISRLNHTELESLFSKVTQQLVFNAYEISKEIDVFVAFETMNNRGKPLSTLELLKNRLIYLVANAPEAQPGDGKMLRKQINDAWAVVYHNLGRNESRPLSDDDFLQTHLANYYHQKVAMDMPSDEDQQVKFMGISYAVLEGAGNFLLRNHFTRRRFLSDDGGKNPLTASALQEYAADLRSASDTYFKISTPSSSGYSDAEKIYLERLGRLRGYGASPIVLAIYRRESNAKLRAQFLEAFERYLFCISLKGGYRVNARASMLDLDTVKYIKGMRKTDEMVTLFNNFVDQLFKEDSLSDILHDWTKNGPGYYGWRSVRYFLFEYELSLQTKSRSDRSKIDWAIFCKEEYRSDYVSVEHIYPQRARAQYWVDRFGHLSPTNKRRLRNSLGNLLALSTPKNSSLGNKSFPEKVGSAKSTTGYRFGSYSENEVAMSDQWTPEEIVDRGIRMLTFMETHWQLSIGDRSQKLRALGLHSLKLDS
ncbi:DUF262 domain-containing protein [Alicycliphilus denitrificans]|uniref:DUF262 domain-containing protein n=1 Tax=Alicycliphilus denitrificans TaxID=179636 RepID=UPI003A80D56D